MSRKKELLEIDADEPEMLHAILSKLPKPLDLEHLITRTAKVFRQYPPEKLPGGAWRQVSAYSVLKTTHDHPELAKQTLEDGEEMFKKHDAEIRRREDWERRQKRIRMLVRQYRGPATFTGAAFLFAILAYAAGRNGTVQEMLVAYAQLLSPLRMRALTILREAVGW
jgi:TBC1 domain family member 20